MEKDRHTMPMEMWIKEGGVLHGDLGVKIN